MSLTAIKIEKKKQYQNVLMNTEKFVRYLAHLVSWHTDGDTSPVLLKECFFVFHLPINN